MTILEWGMLATIVMISELRFSMWRQSRATAVVAAECSNPAVRKKLAKILLVISLTTLFAGCLATAREGYRVTKHTPTPDGGWVEQETQKEKGSVDITVPQGASSIMGALGLGGSGVGAVALGYLLTRRRKAPTNQGDNNES